jgi:hypothetical protein
MGRMSAEYRRVLEKLLFAHYLHLDSWDGAKYRKTADECLAWLLDPGDTRNPAYLQYEYLRGRDEDFPAFAREALGFADDAQARQALWAAFGARAERGIDVARARGGY